jgi:hypothetical protein
VLMRCGNKILLYSSKSVCPNSSPIALIYFTIPIKLFTKENEESNCNFHSHIPYDNKWM